MTLQKHIDRMNYLCKLIENEATGTPEELSEKLSLSKRHTFNLLNNLKEMGAEIKFSRMKESYYFSNSFTLSINVKVSLSDNEDCE